MSQIHDQFITLVQQIADNKDKLHQFINGTAEETIDTDEGEIPTLSGIYAELIASGGSGGPSRTDEEVATIAHSATPEWTPSEQVSSEHIDYSDNGNSTPGISVPVDDANLTQYSYTDDAHAIAVARLDPEFPFNGKVISLDGSTGQAFSILADSALTATEVFNDVSANDLTGKLLIQCQNGEIIIQNDENMELYTDVALPVYLAFEGGPSALVISVYDASNALVGATQPMNISSAPSRSIFPVMGSNLGHAVGDTVTIDFSAAGWAGSLLPATQQMELATPSGATGSGREYLIAQSATALGIDFGQGEYWRFPKTGGLPERSATAQEAKEALDAAMFAQEEASSAQGSASTAQSTADAAQLSADDAQVDADLAQLSADDAQVTANDAYNLAESADTVAAGSRRNAHTGLSVFSPLKGDGTVTTNFTITANENAIVTNVNNYQFALEQDPDTVSHATSATAELDQTIMPNEDFKFLKVKFEEGATGSGQAKTLTINDGGSYYLFQLQNYILRHRLGASTNTKPLQTRDGNSWGGSSDADAVYQVGFGKIAGKLHFLILSETNELIDRIEISEADYDFTTPLTFSVSVSHYSKLEISAPNEAVNFPIDQSNGVASKYLVKEGTVQKMPITGIFYNFINDRIEAYIDGQLWLPGLSAYRLSKKREVAGTSTTLTQADAGGVVLFDTADPCSITLPEASTERIDELSRFKFRNKQGGAISLVTEGTDTLVGGSVTSDSTQLNEVYIETAGTPNNWVADGNFT